MSKLFTNFAPENETVSTKKGKIVVVDDNAGIRRTMEILLPLHFAAVRTIASPTSLISELDDFQPDVVLLDMNFTAAINTGGEGLYWIGEIKRRKPSVEVVLFTAYADVQLAVEGMKRGAFDFIVKPWQNDKLLETLSLARDKAMRAEHPSSLSPHPSAFFWGTSPAMQVLRRNVSKIAPTDATVLITGENGTGKDMLARAIHADSLRRNQPLVAVDAGAIPETLFESELFGHVKGAFTDAHSDHEGKFEQANGGTLFLDEIGNIPLHLQAKLLRAIQSRSIVRVGGTKTIPVDIRLICATNMDLPALIREGRFREDLFYRINTVHLMLPPLRERREDILPLAELFLSSFAEHYHRPLTGFDEQARQAILSNRWNGNIRELQNVIEKAVILSEGTVLTARDILSDRPDSMAQGTLRAVSEAEEERMVREAVERFHGNISAAAKALGISRPTLYAKLKKFGL
ncbi:MAG: sigma-54-dependent Fis family transcriptional regulator [Paludibacteraceae bacterium]|nr:sigma-54-dependent Fis family transcriptional regulator [Paludibacteraceae bacterium]